MICNVLAVSPELTLQCPATGTVVARVQLVESAAVHTVASLIYLFHEVEE